MQEANLLKTPLPSAYLIPVFVSEQEEAYLLSKIEELGGTEIIDDNTDSGNEPSGSASARKFRSKPSGWKEVRGRRSMYWGGSVVKDRLVPLPLPSFMTGQFPRIMERVAQTTAFEQSPHRQPNHVLVNEYLPGQGIFPHQDGPAYFPTVATLSLGSHTILDIYEYEQAEDAPVESSTGVTSQSTSTSRAYKSTPLCSILLPKRSLFVLRDNLYKAHLHGIAERYSDSLDELSKCVNWEDISSRRSRWEMGDEENNTKEWPRGRRVSLTMRAVEKILKNPFSR